MCQGVFPSAFNACECPNSDLEAHHHHHLHLHHHEAPAGSDRPPATQIGSFAPFSACSLLSAWAVTSDPPPLDTYVGMKSQKKQPADPVHRRAMAAPFQEVVGAGAAGPGIHIERQHGWFGHSLGGKKKVEQVQASADDRHGWLTEHSLGGMKKVDQVQAYLYDRHGQAVEVKSAFAAGGKKKTTTTTQNDTPHMVHAFFFDST